MPGRKVNRAANRAAAEERRAAEAKANAARPVGEVRTFSTKRNNRGGNPPTITNKYQKWDGKKWVNINKTEYDKVKKTKTAQTKPPVKDKPPETPPPPATPVPVPAKNPPKSEKFQQLRYPRESIENGQDYIKFDILNYKRLGLVSGAEGVRSDKSNVLGTIILPIPAQISDSNTANYGASSMNNLQAQGIGAAAGFMQSGNFTQAGANLQGIVETLNANKDVITQGLAAAAINSFGGNITLEQVMARSSGAIINPNQELLFSGPGLRQFKFSFKFTPRFEKESLEVKKIIKAFKRNMAPKGGGQDLLGTPNIFQINYMQGSGEHRFLHKFKLCALTNMSVNYTGDGVHATYHDGTPISMQMDLSFNELSPIYSEDYNEIETFEKGHLGVGY